MVVLDGNFAVGCGSGTDYPQIHIFQCMTGRTDDIMNEVLEPITFVLAYRTVSLYCLVFCRRPRRAQWHGLFDVNVASVDNRDHQHHRQDRVWNGIQPARCGRSFHQQCGSDSRRNRHNYQWLVSVFRIPNLLHQRVRACHW